MGLALLIGMVVVTAVLVFVAGGAVLEGLGQETTATAVTHEATVLDDRVTTTVATGTTRDVPFEGVGDTRPRVEDGSHVTIAIERDGQRIHEVDHTFGSVVYEMDDRSTVYEAGGIWKVTEVGSVVERYPDVSYRNESDQAQLELSLVNLEADDGSDHRATRATYDEEGTMAFEEDVAGLFEHAEGGDTLVFEVESEDRSAAWADALSETLNADRHEEVSVERSGTVTTARIHGLVQTEVVESDTIVNVPPGTLEIEVVGTEASLHDTSESDDGTCDTRAADPPCRKGWIPLTTSVVLDGEEAHRFPEGSSQDGELGLEHDLNTPDTWGEVERFTTELDEEATVTLEASLWHCVEFGFTGYQQSRHQVTGEPWIDYECVGGLSDEPDLTVDPIGNPDEGNLVVLEDGDVVPNLEQPGVGQMSVNEMLEDDVDEETGELRLDENEYVFLGELTEPDTSFDEVDPDDSGDPNFNDLVVRMRVDPDGVTTVNVNIEVNHVRID